MLEHQYPGSGTEQDPYLVEFYDNDPRDPMNFPSWIKWSLTQVVGFLTLSVAFISSAYSSGIPELMRDLGGNQALNTLGLSFFVLGFVFGPLLWAPLSELYGRQYLFLITYTLHTVFNAAICASQNLATLLVLRFFSRIFGASPLTNAGGLIADIFPAAQRGVAMTVFALAPFLGPILGPIIGGFVAETVGWRWLMGLMALFTGTLLIVGAVTLPETYAPVLLRRRAARLRQITGRAYVSRIDVGQQGKPSSPRGAFELALSRSWILMFREPIVLLLSLYQAIVFGTLYLTFAAFPIVYDDVRGWSQGIAGLAFLGVMVGMLFAIAYALRDNKRYLRVDASGFAPPEARLPPCCIGGVAIPVGLFWFAWTNGPNIHWMVSIAAGVPFGFGMVLMMIGIMNYLLDSYTIFAASVLAGGVLMRAVFAAVFPLFTPYMYDHLGIHWASSIPAFLALLCTPLPFIFYRYGPAIRQRCKYAAEAESFLHKVRGRSNISSSHHATSA